jgi:hypothetical protein
MAGGALIFLVLLSLEVGAGVRGSTTSAASEPAREESALSYYALYIALQYNTDCTVYTSTH